SALYEQRRVHHVGIFGPLEDQMTSYDGSRNGPSPDRLDALCWGVTELMLQEPPGGLFKETALLVKPPESEAAIPVAMPRLKLGGVFASVAASVGPDPLALGVVFFGLSVPPDELVLTVLDWDLQQVDSSMLNGWAPAVYGRLTALKHQCSARGSAGVIVEPRGIGATLLQLLPPEHAHEIATIA